MFLSVSQEKFIKFTKRSPGQGLRKVSGRQIVRFVQKEKINSEVILSNATVTDNPKEADTEN